MNLYILPESSPLYERSDNHRSILQQIEDIISEINLTNAEYIICGDLNARTSDMLDYIVCNSNIPFFLGS